MARPNSIISIDEEDCLQSFGDLDLNEANKVFLPSEKYGMVKPWTLRRKKRKLEAVPKEEPIEDTTKDAVNVDVWATIMFAIVCLEDLLNLSYSCRAMRDIFEHIIRYKWKRSLDVIKTGKGSVSMEDVAMPYYRIVNYFFYTMRRRKRGFDATLSIRIVIDNALYGPADEPEPPNYLQTYAKSNIKFRAETDPCLEWLHALGYSTWNCMNAMTVLCEESLQNRGSRFEQITESIAKITLSGIIDAVGLYLATQSCPRIGNFIRRMRDRIIDMNNAPVLMKHQEPRLIRMLLADYEIWKILLSPFQMEESDKAPVVS